MIKSPIFPFSRLAGLLAAPALSICTAFVHAAPSAAAATNTPTTESVAPAADNGDPDATLKAQKLPHQENIAVIEYERRAWQRDLAKREDQCLKRFFSSGCIDDLRKEHLREMRDYDLRKEAELQEMRNIDAEIRQRVRARKELEANNRSATEKPADTDSKGRP